MEVVEEYGGRRAGEWGMGIAEEQDGRQLDGRLHRVAAHSHGRGSAAAVVRLEDPGWDNAGEYYSNVDVGRDRSDPARWWPSYAADRKRGNQY